MWPQVGGSRWPSGPADGVKILDLLNDFDRTKRGNLLSPNFLAGGPLDIVMKGLLPGGAFGLSTVFNLSLRWTPK